MLKSDALIDNITNTISKERFKNKIIAARSSCAPIDLGNRSTRQRHLEATGLARAAIHALFQQLPTSATR